MKNFTKDLITHNSAKRDTLCRNMTNWLCHVREYIRNKNPYGYVIIQMVGFSKKTRIILVDADKTVSKLYEAVNEKLPRSLKGRTFELIAEGTRIKHFVTSAD
jgi:endo-alpha-1,4-polygalactosaminidase (GH114 family)